MVEATAIRQDRLPIPEIANRAATAGAGIAAAAKAVGLADHKRMLEDHAQRVRDTHRMQMAALGHPIAAADAESEDMGGDVFVCGDITTTQQAPPPAAAATPAAAAAVKIWPYVLAAALGSGGLGLGTAAAINAWTSRTETPSVGQPAADPDTQWELRISSGEGKTK